LRVGVLVALRLLAVTAFAEKTSTCSALFATRTSALLNTHLDAIRTDSLAEVVRLIADRFDPVSLGRSSRCWRGSEVVSRKWSACWTNHAWRSKPHLIFFQSNAAGGANAQEIVKNRLVFAISSARNCAMSTSQRVGYQLLHVRLFYGDGIEYRHEAMYLDDVGTR
jgi:hypothetical protein